MFHHKERSIIRLPLALVWLAL